jgi:glucose-6-phosphate dehydrogenase assembly protein OpcA
VAETLQPILLGEPRPVNVAEIEADLSALWRSAADDPALQNAVTRACTLTLLIYVESEDAGREVNDLIAEVTRQNPCRAIVLIAEPEAALAGLAAWISARCHLPAAGEKQVCSEQVTIWARGEAAGDLSGAVLPLTVSGLPICLWWRAGRFAPPAFLEQLLRVSNHVMVDSARFPSPETDLRDLARWVQKSSEPVTVTDLNWARITPWRELLAQCFDAAERRPYLDRLTKVRIEYERESPRVLTQRSQGLLLAGWLASRLGWRFVEAQTQEEGGPAAFLFRCGERAVRIERVARRFEGGGCGVCFSIELQAEGASPARFSFARGLDGKVVRTLAEVPGLAPIGRTVRLEVLNEVEILNEELKLASPDRIYEETLRMVACMTASAR